MSARGTMCAILTLKMDEQLIFRIESNRIENARALVPHTP